MNSDNLHHDSCEFKNDILSHYGSSCCWIQEKSATSFSTETERALHNLWARASLGWGMHEFFFTALGEFTVAVLMSHLGDEKAGIEQGHAFSVVEGILLRAHLELRPNAPHREVIEFEFYRRARSSAPELALAQLFSKYWECAHREALLGTFNS